MVIAEVLFAGGWQTAHSFSLPNRLMPTFGVRRRVFDDESHHPIDLGERFLRRRISGYFEDRLFRMATGPIRLAQMLDEKELTPIVRLSNNVNQLANNTVKVIYALVSLNET